MSHEKVGRITFSDGQVYSREQPGIDLPYDFMTKEEREKLSYQRSSFILL